MKTKLIHLAAAMMALSIPSLGMGQTDWGSVFSTLKLEARGDMQVSYSHDNNQSTVDLGLRGKYFDLKVGGDLGDGFSYYLRQNIRANSGSIAFFDNTDFLWLNYDVNDHFRLRFGKDAMAVGGYEYDAAPIDEYMVATYWDNFYCFQMAVSAAYSWDDGRQSMVAQVSQSPYVNSRGLAWDAGLLAYNVEWMGSIGEHCHTLWSVNMLERERGKYMNLIFLGTQLAYERWDLYYDLMLHALAIDDWGKNFGSVARFNYHLDRSWTLFAKMSYEQNLSDVDSPSLGLDNLVGSGERYERYGLGCEYRPKGKSNVRMHGYVGYRKAHHLASHPVSWDVNVGATWSVDFAKMIKK